MHMNMFILNTDCSCPTGSQIRRMDRTVFIWCLICNFYNLDLNKYWFDLIGLYNGLWTL